MLKTFSSHALHLLAEALLGLVGVLALVGCVIVWRLAQGPIDITQLLQREQNRLPTGGVQLSVSSAALAWEGFHDPDSPLDIRFTSLRLRDVRGAPLAQIPAGRVTLAPLPLWRGRLVPRTVELQGAAVALYRNADGALRLDLGSDTSPQGPGAAPLIAGLTKPGGIPLLAQLTSVRLDQAAVTLHDAALGVLWRADAADIVLRRQADGTVSGDAALNLAVGAAHARLASRVELSPTDVKLVASLTTPLSPADLSRAVPTLPTLAAIDVPITGALSARFNTDLRLLDATLTLQASAGTVQAGVSAVGLASAAAVLRTDGTTTTLKDFRVALTQAAGSRLPGPTLTGNATVHKAETGRLAADLDLNVDRVAFTDLTAYWPPGMAGGARSWITKNITAGVAQNAQVYATLDLAPDGSDLRVVAASGGLDGRDLIVWWLRPIPGIEHGDAHLTIEGPDSLRVDVPHATQGKLALSDGSIRITGLSAKDQLGNIVTQIDGSLPDVLSLLNHPRLKLLSRRDIPLRNPTGQVSALLTVKLPLDDRVALDDLGIAATAKLANVHLSEIAAGRDLDHGQLNLKVDTNSLQIDGDGELAGIPSHLGVMMDFRNGPSSQILESMNATGLVNAAQFAGAQIPATLLTGGSAGFDITYESRRDATGSVDIGLDLDAAALSTPFGWSKQAGEKASLSARLVLTHDTLSGIDRIAASGPGLSLASHVETISGKPSVLKLDRVQMGRTDVHGSVGLPNAAEKKWRVMLRGPALDLSGYLKQRDATEDDADDDSRGAPWQADLGFDQVILARDETLAPVIAKAESDGLHFTNMEVSAGAGGQVRAIIQPSAAGRSLRVDAADAGAVLLAAGVANNIRGGQLKLDGNFDDRAPHAPLSGTATLEHFRITDAPAVGRLLKAMTLYGAVDLLRGPGMGFQKAVAPFRWQQRVLTLNSARAFSASLGLTAQGDIDLRHRTANVTGTIVPAYFFNQLLGNIPLLGKLFSPEKGGGVFAARYAVRGKLADPTISVNALSALTPGILRNLFGLF